MNYEPLTDTELNRARGLMWGLLCGDALGSTYEFCTPDQLDGPPIQLGMVGGGPFDLKPGQLTDDGELALCLLKSLAFNDGEYSAAAAMTEYKKWFDSYPVDCGATIAAALSGAGLKKDSEANGALMRVAPIALTALRRVDIEQAVFSAQLDGALTHIHLNCDRGNRHFTRLLVAALKYPPQFPADGWYGYIYDRMKNHEFGALCQWKEHPPRDYVTNQGWVVTAMHNAVYQFFNAVNFEEGISATIRQGGDTDTNAAIAGALLGAKFGFSGIPAHWIAGVQNCQSPRARQFGVPFVNKWIDRVTGNS